MRCAIVLFSLRACWSATDSFESAQQFLTMHCQKCHQDKAGAGGFKLQRIASKDSLHADGEKWKSLAMRVKNGEMPPRGAPAPTLDERESFTQWVESSVRAEACGAGISAGPSPIRRLNRDEYSATLRDLLDMHLDIGHALPADGAGGEGFDNAAETLFLSPLHSEKYMEAAKFATDFAAKEFKSRGMIFGAKNSQPDQVLRRFLYRVFRRPVTNLEVAPYLALFQTAQKQGETFESSMLFALRGALVSPLFLYRFEPVNPGSEARLLDHYSMASRLSYFLWGSMPDEFLFDIAAAGKLQDSEVLQQLIPRMIKNDRSLGFAQRFAEQWLRTRELTTDKVPDAKLFPGYAASEDLRSDIRLQPVLFLREVFIRNLSLLNLLDSTHTIATRLLEKHMDEKLPLNQAATSQPQWVELPKGSRRGGLLGMPAVLTVSSYPYRTSPVLRGAWILEAMLGTPPPPPPPNVPALEEPKEGSAKMTVRERLAQHRENPNCAGCHSRIDPMGFALENYDAIGRWREEDGGKPVDNSGELLDGTKFNGPLELKKVLMDRKDLFIRNLASKMLGYALGRGLTLKDGCAVDSIVAQVKSKDYKAQALLEAVVLSVPFRYQAGVVDKIGMKKEVPKP